MNADECQAVNDNGEKCTKLATNTHDYFGDTETMRSVDGWPGWVRVNLCADHNPEWTKGKELGE